MAGSACTPLVYRSALYELGVAAVALAVTVAAALALWRYGRRLQRAQRRSREHAEVARITGRALAGTGAVVLDDPRPAAYCDPGRALAGRGPIVVTSGALAVLDPPQLSAVLAHERAHLAARHHAIVTATRALTAALPAVPLFTRGAREVARLAEMSADDAAAAVRPENPAAAVRPKGPTASDPVPHGPHNSGSPGAPSAPGSPVAPGALAAAGYAVGVRVERMLRPARPFRHAVMGMVLAGLLTTVLLIPVALAAFTT